MIRTFAAILLAALSLAARAQTCSLTPADLQLLLTQSGQDIVESYTGVGASNAALTAQVTTLQQQVADLQAKLTACSGGNPPPPMLIGASWLNPATADNSFSRVNSGPNAAANPPLDVNGCAPANPVAA